MHTSPPDAVIARNIARIADDKNVKLEVLARAIDGISEERLRQYLVHGRGSLNPLEIAAIAIELKVDPSILTDEVAA